MINLEDITNKEQSPFNIPEGYFDGLETSILHKAKRKKRITLATQIISVAALIAVISIGFWQNEQTYSLDKLIENASNEEIYSMMDYVEFDPLNI